MYCWFGGAVVTRLSHSVLAFHVCLLVAPDSAVGFESCFAALVAFVSQCLYVLEDFSYIFLVVRIV